MNCPNCSKELEQTKGKRPKIFCDSTCRSNYWQKEKRRKKFDADLKTEEARRNNPLINAARGRDASGVNEDEVRGEGVLKAIERSNPKPYKHLTVDEMNKAFDRSEEFKKKEDIEKWQSEYNELKVELTTLGQGQFANQRRKFLEKKIKELQKLL